ncbi:DUF5686 and carboxypeptidase regulatory-like domain-containing protein [Flavobacterium pallidum]|uniref:Carboxypeptidase-like regulatory domain-containing protein n=1 Tax=Flavobacterium pallidum TaxID=2172098 RepID=A0A2S1SL55_9FLAO|nr:DUF5686 and carboxypeptidase regulatory-like domain-containing protein [Flavobacterium pallidum]AWI27096.1 hypothetical protein HYN49_14950 [Flavobacterium pallidum]
MKQLFTLLLLCLAFTSSAQIRGTVTDDQNVPLPLVTVLIENTYNGTSANDQGQYELNITRPGKYTLIFQYLGFKTKKVTVNIDKFPFIQNAVLSEENLSLSEVVINTKDNPADRLIKKAIAAKKENSSKTARYTADFYSRGIFKLKDMPKKIFGEEVGDMDGMLDSTGTGILYLSETVSKITFEKPDNLKERIIASKISGNDNGFSYNTAGATVYDFYDNTLKFGINVISPIADNAFNYYKYKLEGNFTDENNNIISKVRVIPRRDSEPVFDGFIYIVEDSWAIYAVDVDIKGYRIKQEFLDTMKLVQNFGYNQNNKIWSKNTQSLEFTAGIFGIKFNGKFSYVYTNYDFKDAFAKKTFTNEIVSFEDNSNKKDDTYWNSNRQIPLSDEESKDYVKKDSIYKVRNSKTYLDSIDKKNNRFRFLSPITGYRYANSYEKRSFNYQGLLNLGSLSFNTVQGWNIGSGFSYRNWKDEEKGRYTSANAVFNYGFAEDRLRVKGDYYHRFNNQNYAFVAVSGGSTVSQYNPEEPIGKLVNLISTLFFKDNYMKLYNKEYAGITYGRDIANGLNLAGRIEYQQRKALVNNTDYTVLKNDDLYTSNNPLDPFNDVPAFATHHLTKGSVYARINFGNKYITRPDGKINLRNQDYPTLFLTYDNAFGASKKEYEYQLLSGRIYYDFTAGNKGTFSFNIKGGKFFNADDISFIDYKHFNGNQTHIGKDERYLNVFNLLPYYAASTNDSYSETHIEYDDKGYIINKLPLLNLLKAKLILGAHNLAVPDRKPYQEFTVGLDNLGFGKFRMLRVDYVRSYQNGFIGDGVVFGLKFLNILE